MLPVQTVDWPRMVSTLSAICPGDGWAVVSDGEWAVVTSRHLDNKAANKPSRGFDDHGEDHYKGLLLVESTYYCFHIYY